MKLSEKNCPSKVAKVGGQFFKFVYYAMSVSALPISISARINGFIAYIQLTTPSEPASAVSTAMRILRIFPQLVFAFEFIMVECFSV